MDVACVCALLVLGAIPLHGTATLVTYEGIKISSISRQNNGDTFQAKGEYNHGYELNKISIVRLQKKIVPVEPALETTWCRILPI